MSRFTVTWRPAAEEELSRIWLDVADRTAVAKASNEIDLQLKIDPATRGEGRADGLRRLIIPPLTVLFAIAEQDRKVTVVGVRHHDDQTAGS